GLAAVAGESEQVRRELEARLVDQRHEPTLVLADQADVAEQEVTATGERRQSLRGVHAVVDLLGRGGGDDAVLRAPHDHAGDVGDRGSRRGWGALLAAARTARTD